MEIGTVKSVYLYGLFRYPGADFLETFRFDAVWIANRISKNRIYCYSFSIEIFLWISKFHH